MRLVTVVDALHAMPLDTLQSSLDDAIAVCVDAIGAGNKILVCGNGGSAAQASHLVAELLGRFRDRWQWLNVVSLNADSALLTALANDQSYSEVFVHQIRSLGKYGDVLISLTTSGTSQNILRAMARAHAQHLVNVLLTGETTIPQHNYADICLRVPSTDTQRIQEMHLIVLHALAAGIQEAIYGVNGGFDSSHLA